MQTRCAESFGEYLGSIRELVRKAAVFAAEDNPLVRKAALIAASRIPPIREHCTSPISICKEASDELVQSGDDLTGRFLGFKTAAANKP